MKKILVIEDDLDIAEIVEMALCDRYDVRTQTDNDKILNTVSEFVPDLIMIDNQLGQKQASEIMNEIKDISAYKNIPFVLFSGHQDIQRIAGQIEANAYLAKPFSLIDLYSCVDDVLSKCA